MKAIGVSGRTDLARAAEYAPYPIASFSTPSLPGRRHPGGNGLTFDWEILAGLDLAKPFLVSGGLDAENVATALAITRAPGVDVSSGVESAPGVKDPLGSRPSCSPRGPAQAPGCQARPLSQGNAIRRHAAPDLPEPE